MESYMSLRNQVIRLAASLPQGSDERRLLLATLQEKVAARSRLDGLRKHTLMPANIARKIPRIGATSEIKDPMVWVKFFSPYMRKGVWYITEYDGNDELFGYADLGMGGGELGYMSLSELADSTTKLDLPAVERDLYWNPMPLSKAKQD